MRPSETTISAPVAQPSSDCGPPIEAISSGMVMKGPTPTMLDMFSAVACSRPKPRVSCGVEFVAISRKRARHCSRRAWGEQRKKWLRVLINACRLGVRSKELEWIFFRVRRGRAVFANQPPGTRESLQASREGAGFLAEPLVFGWGSRQPPHIAHSFAATFHQAEAKTQTAENAPGLFFDRELPANESRQCSHTRIRLSFSD